MCGEVADILFLVRILHKVIFIRHLGVGFEDILQSNNHENGGDKNREDLPS